MPKRNAITWTSSDGELIFDFRPAADGGSPCDVEVSVYPVHAPWQAHKFVLPGNGTRYRLELKFAQNTAISGICYLRPLSDAAGARCVWGIFTYSDKGHNNLRFDGCMVELGPCGGHSPVPPVGPPADFPEPPSTPIIDDTRDGEDLFPYVYMRYWPQLDSATLAFSFVCYPPEMDSPPSNTFITQLETIRSSGASGARDGMLALAQSFLEGLPPFQGMYLADIDSLGRPMSRFPEVLSYVIAEPEITEVRLWEELPLLVGMERQDLIAFLLSPDYRQSLQQVWASYFALVIILGYQHANLMHLLQVLRCSHLLEQCFFFGGSPPAILTSAQLHRLAAAPILLPNEIFPLPPSGLDFSPPLPKAQGWIEPYAIGDLQMLRRRFLRYQAGDISHVENVMAGERRTVMHKRTNRQLEIMRKDDLREDHNIAIAGEQSDELKDELRSSIAEFTVTDDYTNLTTSYGPPTQAIIDGTVTKTAAAGDNPGIHDRTQLARRVLDRSINRIRRNVNLLRGSSTLDEHEDARESVFDNSNGEQDRIGVYRWLNRIYRARVINYGTRLMLEFMILHPAARFIKRAHEQLGLELERPLSLVRQGVRSYQDIDAANSVRLAAYYGVEAIMPPPQSERIVSAALRGGEQRELPLPDGYCVVAVKTASVAAAQEGVLPELLVGGQKVPANGECRGVELFGEEGSLTVIVPESMSNVSSPCNGEVAVTLRVECALTKPAFNAWQIKTYDALAEGCRRRVERFYREAGERQGWYRKPATANRAIERGSLKQDCITLMLLRRDELCGKESGQMTGDGAEPAPFVVNEPRYLQFFDEVLEWSEMSYTFYTGAGAVEGREGAASPDDPLFTAFLEADSARVLVPARPGRAMVLLYYFSSGLLWYGGERGVAVNPADAALVHELLQAETASRSAEQPVGEPWEIVVPTMMQILDELGSGGLWAQGEG
jgi:hypothetical protein